jgi:hypothetical protein
MFLIHFRENRKGQSRMDNTETLGTLGRPMRLQKKHLHETI